VKIQGTTSTTKANINNYQHGQRNTILPTTTPKTYMKEYIYLERNTSPTDSKLGVNRRGASMTCKTMPPKR
jgi:hypothetical protein